MILLLQLILAYSTEETTTASPRTLPQIPAMPGMGMGGFPPMMMGCAMYARNPTGCKAHFPMCQWVFDEDMWTCMEAKEVESQKGFWTAQNMPGAPQMNPAMAAMIGSEGEMPESQLPVMLPPIPAGGMAAASLPGMNNGVVNPAAGNTAQKSPFNTGMQAVYQMGPEAAELATDFVGDMTEIAVDAGLNNMIPGMGGMGGMPMMMMSCEMIHNAKQCGAQPGCTWIFDDNMMSCIETKEVENHKAFWIGQQGQMFPQGPMAPRQGGMPGVQVPAVPGPAPGSGMHPAMMMMMPCETFHTAQSCHAQMPRCQWVLDETLWACMEPKEVESNKNFWNMHNMMQGGPVPGLPAGPGGRGMPAVSTEAATTTTEAAADTGPVDPALVLAKTQSFNQQASESSEDNTLLLASVTVLGFAFGIILALLGLHYYNKSSKKTLETILLDQQGVVRQV